ncbi:MAG TPA: hypothetical protein VGC25_07330 [Alphaproteobacteria bacterium]|jgi:hypothetical protein
MTETQFLGDVLVFLAAAVTMVPTPALAALGRRAEAWLSVEAGGVEGLAEEASRPA